MKTGMGLGAEISAERLASLIGQQHFLVETLWHVEHFRGENMIAKTMDRNICTDQGLNALLNIMFHASTQITAWHIALFESDTSPAAGTTYATPGYTECSAYNESARVSYVEAAAAAKVMTNSANKATFTMNATKTIYGAALVGGGSAAATKGDTAGGGTIYCASKFASAKDVESGDVLKVTITIAGADA